jgi:hypothetical protein
MANDYYEHDNPFVAGTLVASAAVNSQLDLIETGFEAAEATLAKTVQVPSDFTGITQIPSQTFPNKLIYINTAGNVDLYSLAAFDASVTASADSATASADSAAAAANSATAAATQVGLATDQVGLATDQVGLATTQVGLATAQVGLATGQVGLATTQAGLAAGSASDAADSATAAAANSLPTGTTTNSMLRYNGSSWVETDKLQVDAAGVVTATAGLQSTGAGTDSFRAGKLAGETNQGNNGIIISSKGLAVDDATEGHIHIASDEASLDYTNADGWSATDTVGSFALRSGGGGDGAFPDNPQGNPIFLVLTGQSNAVGIYPETIANMPQNSEVFDWQSAGQGPTGTFGFSVAAPARNLSPAFANGAMITGMPGSYPFNGSPTTLPRGHIGWSAANYIQKQTGRRVYLLSVAWSGKGISEWASGATVEAELASQISDALTAIQVTYPTVTAPDAVIWMQGESDFTNGFPAPPAVPTAVQIAAAETRYVTKWLAFKTLAETKWAAADYTQWLVCETVQYNPLGATPAPNVTWSAFKDIVAQTDMRVKLISSVGAEATIDVAWHYKGTGLTQLGIRAGAAAMEGSLLSSNEASSLNWKNGGTTSTAGPDVPFNDDAVQAGGVSGTELLVPGNSNYGLLPAVPATQNVYNVTAFDLDTTTAITELGKLAKFSNQGIEKMSIGAQGEITVDALKSGTEVTNGAPLSSGLVVANPAGKQIRSPHPEPVYLANKASAQGSNLLGLIALPDDSYGTIQLDVQAKNLVAGTAHWFKVDATYKRVAVSGVQTLTFPYTGIDRISNPAPSILSSYVAISAYFSILAIYVNGPSGGGDIHWLVTGNVFSIPTTP